MKLLSLKNFLLAFFDWKNAHIKLMITERNKYFHTEIK
jgi:hypothetical protein